MAINPRRGEAPLVYLSSEFIRAKEYLEAIVASTTDAICTTDLQGRVIYFSPGAERMTGRKAAEVAGQPVHALYEGGRDEAERLMKLLRTAGTVSNHRLVLCVGGRRVHIAMSASLLRDRAGRVIGTLGISKDITEQVTLEERLRELSITDNLTGLFNRRHLDDRAASELARARRQRGRLSAVVIDLDRFKQANDRWGHLEGDRLLRRAAEAINASIRSGVDAAFRTGGDEFVVLLPGSGLHKAAVVGRRIEARAGAALAEAAVGVSWGAAGLRPGDTLQSLLARADRRMYLAKRGKRRPGGPSPRPRSPATPAVLRFSSLPLASA